MAYLLLAPAQEAEEEKKVWPGRAVGSPQPNPSSLFRGGGKETHFTYQHKGGLVLCLCVS